MKIIKKAILIALLTVATALVSLPTQAATVQQVILHTVNTNPEILLSTHVRQSSRYSVGVATAGYFPKIDVNAGWGRENSRNITTGPAGATLNRREAGIFLNQMIFDGAATHYEVQRTENKTNADAFRVWGTAENIALETIEYYLNVMRDRRLVGIARRHLARISEIFNLVKQRGESGLGREADIHQARGRLELARTNLYSAQQNLSDSVANYYRATDLMPTNLVMPPVPNNNVLPRSKRSAVHMAVDNNPLLKSSVADVAEAVAQYKASKSVNYPRLDLQVGANHNRNIDGAVGPNQDVETMLRVNYNIFNGGADANRQKELAYEVNQAEDIRVRTLREVIESATIAWNGIVAGSARLPALRRYRTAAGKTVVAYVQQFKIGKRTLLDLLDSEDEYFRVRNSYVSQYYELVFEKYRMLNTMGRGLAFLQVPLPLAAHVPYHENYIMPHVYTDASFRTPYYVHPHPPITPPDHHNLPVSHMPNAIGSVAKATDISRTKLAKKVVSTKKSKAKTVKKAAKTKAIKVEKAKVAILPKPKKTTITVKRVPKPKSKIAMAKSKTSVLDKIKSLI